MWSRSILKERAKNVLRVSYWKAFVISLVVAIAVAMGTSSGNIRYRFDRNPFNSFENSLESFAVFGALTAIVIIGGIIRLGIRIFLGYGLEVGGRRYFIHAAQGDINMDYLGYAFKSERYMEIIKAMLWKAVINFLWYLALIIPGIVKSYAYRMVPYILADNPNIGYKRALELSNQMTYGQKMDIFVLDLSFIGWYLLGFIACCIGMFFVTPYVDSTNAELYLVLRQNALGKGICSYEELGLQQFVKTDIEF